MSSEIVAESGVAGMTAGALLRQARETAGLHIAALAVALKVPVSKLEALEADNYAALPDTVFVRALASSVCRTLKVDAAPILAALPQSQSPRLSADSAGLNAPVREHGTRSSSPLGGSTPRSVVLVVLVLLIAALVVMFLPRQHNAAPGDAAPAVAPPAPADTREAPAEAAPAPAAAPAAATAPAPAAAVVAPVATAVALTADAPAAGAAGAPAAAASHPAPAAAATGSELLVLRARGGESWVQVRDAAGTVVLQRNLAAGETAALPGPGPLSVVVGRADATEVSVRGKPFDLAAVTRVNVARFEVK